MSERDTHFADFAKLVVDELDWLLHDDSSASDASQQRLRKAVETIIARRAYDLAWHVLMHTSPANLAYVQKVPGHPMRAPDLDEWPPE